FLQNVFNQQVYREVHYELSAPVLKKLAEHKIPISALQDLKGQEFSSGVTFLDALHEKRSLTEQQDRAALHYAEIGRFVIDPEKIHKLDTSWLTSSQFAAIRELSEQTFRYKWRFAEALAQGSEEWRLRADGKVHKLYNKELKRKLDYVYRTFSVNG
ncbi:MAG: inorganic phosphate transporter, partial [Acidiferrobacterales bacterium]